MQRVPVFLRIIPAAIVMIFVFWPIAIVLGVMQEYEDWRERKREVDER